VIVSAVELIEKMAFPENPQDWLKFGK